MSQAPSPAPWAPSLPQFLLGFVLPATIVALVLSTVGPIYPIEDLPDMGIDPSPELVRKHIDAAYAFETQNKGLNFALIGGLVGLFTGLFTSNRLKLPSAVAATLTGAVAGGGLGFLVGTFLAKTYIVSNDQSLLISFGYHAMIWGSIFAFVLGTVGAFQNGTLGAVVGFIVGVVAGCFASVAYNLVGAIAFSDQDLANVFPRFPIQSVTMVIVCSLCGAVFAHLALNTKKTSENQATSETPEPDPTPEAGSSDAG